MNVIKTALPGVLILEPKIYKDTRGAFCETYNERLMEQAGLPTRWVQDNFSLSRKNVIRGIHYQVNNTQGKLVRVTHGSVWDMAIDLRRSSATFGQHVGVELSGENCRMLWIPEGFGHGFAVLSEVAGFAYKVTGYYSPADERTLLWNDPEIAVPWPVSQQEAIVSEKDQQGLAWQQAELFT
ncbi:dTDP-4-dehydrorhamnose 3,5-epimerase [Alloacidobacterium dinghuense]|uniref:dTDP-4-dehydrorhamnose 3,5-epimerase n=1 Tax=Alloacidobacterium dinghuense TaxID=2763107 RepID=A0A7G8BIJ3_9BACT|nr:dTDP-4-dehydrorhamnose 3,5-epimerase [Alloacidobacterium dinghuense]QNI32363.1 dTDP-4-dehydrorhamnose 3,5-epimerase [Alloacidobacterium dinghuense]